MKRKAAEKLIARKKRKIQRTLATKIKSYVKKAIKAEAETKEFIFGNTTTLGNSFADGKARICNFLYGISEGTGMNEYVGNRYHVTGLSIKMYVENPSNKDFFLYYRIISTNDEVSDAGTQDFNQVVNLIENPTAPVPNWRLNNDKVSVLKSGSIKIFRNGFAGTAGRQKSLFKKLNLKIDKNLNYNKNKNYYLLIYNTFTGFTSDTATLWCDFKVYFKDI